MRLKIILLISFFSCISFAQQEDKPVLFSDFQYGIYSGVNFQNSSDLGGGVLLEGKTSLIKNLKLMFSLGYIKSFVSTNYSIYSYNYFSLEGRAYYSANTTNVNEKGYDIFPFAIGLQYLFEGKNFSPYVMADFGYNYIDQKIYRSGGSYVRYQKYDEIPELYKAPYDENLPLNTYGAELGIGTVYHISKTFGLDLRYFYKIDSQIVNTHHFVIGISFE